MDLTAKEGAYCAKHFISAVAERMDFRSAILSRNINLESSIKNYYKMLDKEERLELIQDALISDDLLYQVIASAFEKRTSFSIVEFKIDCSIKESLLLRVKVLYDIYRRKIEEELKGFDEYSNPNNVIRLEKKNASNKDQ